MRFKLVLLIKTERHGNILPVNYQYELSACIFSKLNENRSQYNHWLEINGFPNYHSNKHQLFSVSNFYIPKIKVESDRLHILAPRIQLWISMLPERGTAEFIEETFRGAQLSVGDKHSQVDFEVIDIVEKEPFEPKESCNYVSLSPIVLCKMRENFTSQFTNPEDPNYKNMLKQNLREKYRTFYGKEFPHDFTCKLEILSAPKRKGIIVKRFTPREVKFIGYMYKFRLTTHPAMHHLLYHTGMGHHVNLGFGCVELLSNKAGVIG